MAIDSVDKRASAQGTFLHPLHPVPAGGALSQADRQQVQGVYAGILASSDVAITSTGRFLEWHHHYNRPTRERR